MAPALLARFLIATIAIAGCKGSIGGDDDDGDDAGPGPGDDGGTSGRDAAPACPTGEAVGTLTDAALPSVPAGVTAFLAATDGGVVVAWHTSGTAHVQAFDLDGTPRGDAATADAAALYGLATSSAGDGLLVSRGSDELHLVVVGGAAPVDRRILGGVPHDVTDNEWFGELIRVGRLIWTGSSWAAYYSVQRLWDDGVAHYGDQLSYFTAGGEPMGQEWGWGCSHSLDVRLADDGDTVAPLCTSDCYPGKGVYYFHDREVFDDPSGNCAGDLDTTLGGIAPIAGGVLTAFASPATRSSVDVAVVKVPTRGAAGAPHWLTDATGADGDVHLAAFGAGGVVGWRNGAAAQLLAVDGSGAPVGAPQALPGPALTDASDFVVLADGAVAWVSTGGGGRLHVLRACN